jgi:hypothetical protein
MANNDAWWRDSTGDEENRKFDKFAHAVTVIAEPHRLLHDGFMFHLSGRASVANGADLDFGIVTAVGTFVHWRKLIWSLEDSPCDIKVYEGATFTGGTNEPPINQNRASSNASTTQMLNGVSVTDVGDLLHDRYVPSNGGAGINTIGIVTPTTDEEWILNHNTKYLVRFTNNSGGTIVANYEFQGYEIGYPS